MSEKTKYEAIGELTLNWAHTFLFVSFGRYLVKPHLQFS